MAWNPYQPVLPYGSNMNYSNPMQANLMQQMNPMSNFQQFAQNPQNQPSGGLIRVTGSDGAKAYPMAPNSVVALFDDTRDVFYVKTSDAGSFSTIKAYAFTPIEDHPNQPIQNTTDFATRQELISLQNQIEEMKGMIENGKQFVSEQTAAAEPKSNSRNSK